MAEQRRVGLLYDERMFKHRTPDDELHPENPNRIKIIWNKLRNAGISQRCVLLDAKEAEDEQIMLVHSSNHVKLIKDISSKKFDSRRARTALKYNSIYFNGGSSEAAYLAAGSVVEVTERVAKGDIDSGVAIVRPPGHHAEHDEPMGFCLFNNVAVAASFILNKKPELGINKILIVDWDVHHGNATQKMFWDDPRVLFFSVHRHEFGSFYPCTDDGFYTKVGEGPGAGYNINVPWENGQCGDADYLAAWDHILIPVAAEFNPDLIIISAGFDAAMGDPLGGCCITPNGYSVLLNKLMKFANGKIVLALEGGYNLDSIANSMLACVEVLLEDKHISGSSDAKPFQSTWRVIQAVRQELSAFWPTLAEELPKELFSKTTPLVQYVPSASSDSEVDEYESINAVSDKFKEILEGIIQPLSALKVDEGQGSGDSESWRRELSKREVWYASFGSNMWQPRFMCYIQGGQVEGMKRTCSGSEDKTPPKEITWKDFPHQLFFGRESTQTWGDGGVAFVNPESQTDQKTHMCLYRITLEQFNDVLLQENILSLDITSPLIGLATLNSLANGDSTSLELNLQKAWYRDVVYLGKEQDIPILTMTCSVPDTKGFKSGKLPLRAPAEKYAETLVRGLMEGLSLSESEAKLYIQQASTKPL